MFLTMLKICGYVIVFSFIGNYVIVYQNNKNQELLGPLSLEFDQRLTCASI